MGYTPEMEVDRTSRRGRLLFETPVPDTALGVRHVRQAAMRAIAAYPSARTAELVISELASNAVAHAGCPCVLGIYECGPSLRIQVQDISDDQPVTGPPMEDNLGGSGRGLQLVQAVSKDFGVESLQSNGKIVWATV